MTREPDLAFEALVRETHANVDAERGKLNAALKAIRAAWQREGGLPEDLPREIEMRAEAYREMMRGLMLTPNALAVHWHRVVAQREPINPQQKAIEELRKENT